MTAILLTPWPLIIGALTFLTGVALVMVSTFLGWRKRTTGWGFAIAALGSAILAVAIYGAAWIVLSRSIYWG